MKPLVVYYSHSGNTRGVAQALAGLTGAGLLELQPARPYPAAYNAVVEQAKREIQSAPAPTARWAPPSTPTEAGAAPWYKSSAPGWRAREFPFKNRKGRST